MSSQKCTEIADLLVDFADGELAEAECNDVTAHLAECPRCREEVELLERSLQLAKGVWQEATMTLGTERETPPAETLRTVKSGSKKCRRRTPRWAVALAVTACAILVLLASVVWRPEPPAPDSPPPKVIAGHTTDPRRPLTDDEVERLISHKARCARLAVSVELLASQPGLEKYRDDARRYLAEVSNTESSDPRSFSNGKTR